MNPLLKLLDAIRIWSGKPKAEEPQDLASRIIRAMKRLGYVVDDKPGELTPAYVTGMNPDGTANDNAPDKWNDLRCLIRHENGKPVMAGKWVATTEPGFYYGRDHIINPKGPAHLKPGQYRAWQVGFHHNDPSRPALVQTGGPVTVWRDRNHDFKNGPGDIDDTGYFGINQHDGQDGGPDSIGPHSAGCLVVRSRKEHAAFMALVKSDPRYVADHQFVFRTALLTAAEVM